MYRSNSALRTAFQVAAICSRLSLPSGISLTKTPMEANLPTREQMRVTLKRVSLFAGLDDQQAEALVRHAVPRTTETGKWVFVEGDECQGLFVVFSGAVKIFKESRLGREQVLTVERAGGVVAELPVFDGGPYPASCKAMEPSILLFVSKRDFRRACYQDPELALQVLASVGRRLRHLVGLVEDISFLTVRSRLATFLLELSREQQNLPATSAIAHEAHPHAGKPTKRLASGAEPLRIPLRLTQQEIGARIGTVRELVSRNLSRFQAEGIIRLDGTTLIIQDPDRLEKEAHSE